VPVRVPAKSYPSRLLDSWLVEGVVAAAAAGPRRNTCIVVVPCTDSCGGHFLVIVCRTMKIMYNCISSVILRFTSQRSHSFHPWSNLISNICTLIIDLFALSSGWRPAMTRRGGECVCKTLSGVTCLLRRTA
jgi:hypothetical protein